MQTNINYQLSFNHLAIQYNEVTLQAFGCLCDLNDFELSVILPHPGT